MMCLMQKLANANRNFLELFIFVNIYSNNMVNNHGKSKELLIYVDIYFAIKC